MASALLITYERKPILSRNTAMKKPQKTSNGYLLDPGVPDHSTASETVAESDGRRANSILGAQNLAASVDPPSETASEDSCSLKRKSMSLNADSVKDTLKSVATSCGFSSKNLSRLDRRQLRKRLKLELQQLRSVCVKLELREAQLKCLPQSDAMQDCATMSRSGANGFLSKLSIESFAPTVEGSHREARLPRQPSILIPDHSQETPGPLSKDKRTPKANQLYMNSEFVSGKDKLPASDKSKSKAGLDPKRILQGKMDSRDSKRQKVDALQSRKVGELLKLCGVLLKKMMTHKHGWIFNEPVDVVKLGLHDYLKIIQKPMDLGSIQKKLDSGMYLHPTEFAQDVRLTFCNAMKYNPLGHDVYNMADTLCTFFEGKWKTVEGKLKGLATGVDLLARDLKEPQVAHPSQVQVHEVNQEHPADVRSSAARKPKPAPSARTPAKPKTKAVSLPKRPMTFAEKQTLSKDLESLPEDYLEQIYQIIKNKDPNLTQTDEGIEVDIEAFDSQTLWELHRFVMECNEGKGKTKKSTAKALPIGTNGVSKPQLPNGVSGLPKASLKGDGGEEEVDIGDDVPSGEYPPVVIEKDGGVGNKNSSSGSSSSGSGSSSSDSDTGSSSESDSDADAVQSAGAVSKLSQADKEPVGSGAVGDRRCSPALEVDGAKRSMSGLDEENVVMRVPLPILDSHLEGSMSGLDEENVVMRVSLPILDSHLEDEGNVPDQDLFPERRLRAAILRNRFAETIFKAQEKNLPLNKSDRTDPEKLKKERELLERRQKEEKARLQAEARAAELARKRVEAEAAAEARRRREAEREAARLALQNMEKTVEIDENSEILKDLERLRSAPSEHIPSSGDETSSAHSSDGLPAFALQEGGNPLEQLGLFMKEDEEDEEHGAETVLNQADNVDASAGEIED